jgi:hypothetical protein
MSKLWMSIFMGVIYFYRATKVGTWAFYAGTAAPAISSSPALTSVSRTKI